MLSSRTRLAFNFSIFLISVLFIFSGFAKIFNLSDFQISLKSQNFPEYFIFIASLIPAIEILIGFCLAFNIVRKLALWICFLMLLFFSVYLVWLMISGIESDCGCFGKLDFLNFSPTWALVRNGILGIGVIYSLWQVRQEPLLSDLSAKSIALFLVAMPLFFISGTSAYVWQGDSQNDVQVSANHFQKGMSKQSIIFSQSVIAEVTSLHRDSTYFLYVYNPNCMHCQMNIENVKSFQRTKVVDKIIGISWENEENIQDFSKKFAVSFETMRASKMQIQRFAPILPTGFLVRRDTIVARFNGEIIPAYLFSE